MKRQLSVPFVLRIYMHAGFILLLDFQETTLSQDSLCFKLLTSPNKKTLIYNIKRVMRKLKYTILKKLSALVLKLTLVNQNS